MADTFPQSHTTTTRTTAPAAKPSVDIGALKTTSGILKVVEIVLSIITFICCVSGCNGHSHAGWGAFVSFTAILLAAAFLVSLLFHVHDLMPSFPLLLFELIIYAVWTLFYLIAGCCLAALSDYARYYKYLWYSTTTCHSSAGAGAFFAFITMLVFGLDTFFIFKQWNKSRSAMPTRNVIHDGPQGVVVGTTNGDA